MSWWYTLKEVLWNSPLSKIEETFWGRTVVGDTLFQDLRRIAPDDVAISKVMKDAKFVWSSDPISGHLDYHSAPRVTCARKKGDCDDYAYLWAELLKGHGSRWILHTRSKEGGGHAMCVFEKDSKFHLLSNLDVLTIVTDRSVLDRYFYGDKTKCSFYTNV